MSAGLLLYRQGCYYVGRVVTVSAGLLLCWQGCYYVGRVVTILTVFLLLVVGYVTLSQQGCYQFSYFSSRILRLTAFAELLLDVFCQTFNTLAGSLLYWQGCYYVGIVVTMCC